MGQTYFVEAKLRFPHNDPKKFCECIKNEIKARNGVTAVFADLSGDMDTPFGCFSNLTRNAEDEGGGLMSAAFDASYGWEGVMEDIFYKAAYYLDDGSYVVIYPDSGWVKISVEGHTIVQSWK